MSCYISTVKIQANYRHELYKLESQIGQQTKLIMYLQDKVENPPKRKKGVSKLLANNISKSFLLKSRYVFTLL